VVDDALSTYMPSPRLGFSDRSRSPQAKARGVKLGGLRDATMKRNEAVKANAQRRADKLAGVVLPMRNAGSSLRDIADELNKLEVTTARGGAWTAMQVKRVVERLSGST